MQTSLYALSATYQQAFFALADSEFDIETIDNTLEGLEGELVEKAQNVLAYALNLDADAAALKELEGRIARRRKAKEAQAEHMREYLKANMAASGITEIRALDNSFIAKLQIGRDAAVVIDDVTAIPTDYMREIPATFAPVKADILKAIKEGYDVPGAHIERRDRLVIS